MRFHAPDAFETTALPADERESARNALYLPIFVLYLGSEKVSALLTDISQNGCNILVATPMMVGEHLGVEVPGLSRFSGNVVWQTRKELGLVFATPISRAEVEYILDIALRSR